MVWARTSFNKLLAVTVSKKDNTCHKISSSSTVYALLWKSPDCRAVAEADDNGPMTWSTIGQGWPITQVSIQRQHQQRRYLPDSWES